MTKISLLGDSIRMQYAPLVKKLLGEDFEVFEPDTNGRFAKYTLRGLFDWQKAMKGSRIVHWNNGLWDICNLFDDGLFTPEKEYTECMLRIADILLKRYDTVIFATTTPVSEKNCHNKNSDIIRYNEMIVPKLKEKGILINDLYSAVAADLDKYICGDTIHMSEAGIQLCAKLTAEAILNAAKNLTSNQTCSCSETKDTDMTGVPVLFE